jgi:hypothetical protein
VKFAGKIQGPAAIGGGTNFVPFFAQIVLEQFQNVSFVVYDEYAGF